MINKSFHALSKKMLKQTTPTIQLVASQQAYKMVFKKIRNLGKISTKKNKDFVRDYELQKLETLDKMSPLAEKTYNFSFFSSLARLVAGVPC